MKKIIKDYNTISKEQMEIIVRIFPDGFDEDDLKKVKLADGSEVLCLELQHEDTCYLFKISDKLLDKLIDYSDGDSWDDMTELFDGIDFDI